MSDLRYNYKGELLTPETTDILLPRIPKQGNGQPIYDDLLEYNDSHGFDVRYEIKTVTLNPGKVVVRYGSEFGSYTTDKGTPYEALSLPYRKESREYHEYVVKTTTTVKCVVLKGIVAPGKNKSMIGGGVQYMHPMPIKKLCDNEIIEEDFSWLHHIKKH